MDRFEVVAEEKYCDTISMQVKKGIIATLKGCADECTNVASMFIYGIEGTIGCDPDGCLCVCEAGASPDGTCNQNKNYYYNLYRFIQQG